MNIYVKLFIVALLWISGTNGVLKLGYAVATNGNLAGGLGSGLVGLLLFWFSYLLIRKSPVSSAPGLVSKYVMIDPIIKKWTIAYGLTLYTTYKDAEVRSVEIQGSDGGRFQIWIDEPEDATIRVHLWDFKKRRKEWTTDVRNLHDALLQATDLAYDWSRE